MSERSVILTILFRDMLFQSEHPVLSAVTDSRPTLGSCANRLVEVSRFPSILNVIICMINISQNLPSLPMIFRGQIERTKDLSEVFIQSLTRGLMVLSCHLTICLV